MANVSENRMEFLSNNWEWVLIAFMIAEKLVKMSPTKYDDIVLDIVWKNIKKMKFCNYNLNDIIS